MKLNFKKLRQDMESVANEIRIIKANGGKSPTQIKCEKAFQRWKSVNWAFNSPEQQEYHKYSELLWEHSLTALKEKATILYSIRADHHSRLHRKKIKNPSAQLPGHVSHFEMTLQLQKKFIEKLLPNYIKQELPINPQV